MVSSGAVAGVAVAFIAASAIGIYYVTKVAGFTVAVNPTTNPPTGEIAFTVANAPTPGGFYTLDVISVAGAEVAQLPVQGTGTSGSSGTFDASGKAAGVTDLARATTTLTTGPYKFQVTDITSGKKATAAFSIA